LLKVCYEWICQITIRGYSFNDVATDDAVSNDDENNYLLMATGKWSSMNNHGPVDNLFSAIQYLNIILEEPIKLNGQTGEYVGNV
jgi:hypothetical protein